MAFGRTRNVRVWGKMMLEDLLKAKRITPEEFDLYNLYQVNELGRKVRDKAMTEMFMDEPQNKEFSGVGFAFYDGRRSYFRDVMRTIFKVQQHIKESTNDGTEQSGR
jgi:hypothetical protein